MGISTVFHTARPQHSLAWTGLVFMFLSQCISYQPGLRGCAGAPPKPPVAEKRRHIVESPHGNREDEYYWLRDDARSNPEVLAHLQAENEYTKAVLKPLQGAEEALFQEITGRIPSSEDSYPVADRGYLYWRQFVKNAEYPVYKRKEQKEDAPEEVLLDLRELAKGHEFYSVVTYAISPDNTHLAFLEDTNGRRQYTIRVKNLRTGEFLPDRVTNVSGHLVWDDTGKNFFYIAKDPVTLLGNQVKRHALGEAVEADALVYEEKDRSFYMSLARTVDHAFMTIRLQSTERDEVRFLKLETPKQTPKVLVSRDLGVKLNVDHRTDRWVVRTNWQAVDFQLVQIRDEDIGIGPQGFRPLVPAKSGLFMGDFSLFETHLAVEQRHLAQDMIRIQPWDSAAGRIVRPSEEAGTVWLAANPDPRSHTVRLKESSLRSPGVLFDVNLETGVVQKLKEDPVEGGHDPDQYITERLWIHARDGIQIPVTLVHKKDLPRNGTAPLYQYAYGSYGSVVTPTFRSSLLSLLDRGVVFAIAHVRGGQEMGRGWYEDGKLLNKRNTFTDFVDVTEGLVRKRYAHPERVIASGGSAGGLLVGAVCNMRPDLYRVAVAHVPFVDVVTTMLDESIPLTTNEFREWGNPKEKPYYEYMSSYSPYDNIQAHVYPAMFVTTGLWDSQVQYFEPAKWVARLRDRKTDLRPIVLQINMEAGHGGATGRFRRYEEIAQEYSFVLDQVGY